MAKWSKLRVVAASLAISGSALVGLAVHEDYRQVAYRPLPTDKPTLGFGNTHGVKMGDTTTPVRALIQLQKNIGGIERDLQSEKCVGAVPLSQNEWDALVDLAYRVGAQSVCRSTLVKIYRSHPIDYAAACKQYLRWTFFQGKDCRDPINKCTGVARRAEDEYRLCLGEKA